VCSNDSTSYSPSTVNSSVLDRCSILGRDFSSSSVSTLQLQQAQIATIQCRGWELVEPYSVSLNASTTLYSQPASSSGDLWNLGFFRLHKIPSLAVMLNPPNSSYMLMHTWGNHLAALIRLIVQSIRFTLTLFPEYVMSACRTFVVNSQY